MRIQGTIRFVETEDLSGIIELCHLHALYEKAAYTIDGKAGRLAFDLFSDYPKVYCLVVENDGQLIGYATYMKQYATWDAKEYVYMDCLFVKEFARGLGIGERLIRRIQKEAETLGCDLVQWQTPDFNTRAIKFYRRMGATSKTKERFFLVKSRIEEHL